MSAPKCLCGHSKRRHAGGSGLCLVASCNHPPCFIYRASAETPAEWFARTGHCFSCGQPGSYCQCTERRPCGCRGLHLMGSGLEADPLDVFAESTVSDEQGDLWS